MKQTLSILIGLLVLNFSGFAQNWDDVALSISSQEGNHSCHRKGLEFTFDYNIALPGNTEEHQGSDVIKETYTLVGLNTGGPVILFDDHGVNSINEPTPFGAASSNYTNVLDLGNASSGNFRAKYPANSGASSMKFLLTAVVRYVRTRTYTDSDDQMITIVVQDESRVFEKTATFAVNDPFSNDALIRVDSIPTDTLKINALASCDTYTLTAASVGATGYQWNLPDATWLVSSASSLTSNTIQIKPDWNSVDVNNVQTITLVASQTCGSSTIQATKNLIVVLEFPELIGDAICFSGGPTTLSIPSAAAYSNLVWTVESNFLNLISGQGTNSIEVQATGYFRRDGLINLTITTPCGVLTKDYGHWMGVPLPQANTLTGVSVSTVGAVRTFTGTPAAGIVHHYTWRIPQNSGPVFQFCTDCWKVRQSSVTSDGEPFAHVQIGKNDGYVQALYENNCGNSSAILYVDVQQSNTGVGSGLCCGPVNAMVAQSNTNNGTASMELFKESVSNTTAFLGSIYPNPVANLLHIEFAKKDWDGSEANLFLYNSTTGQRIYQALITNHTQLNIQHLPAGMYLLEIVTKNQTFREKVIKQ